MAVHAQYAFPHDPRAITTSTRQALDNAMSASPFLGEPGGCGGGDLTCIINNNYYSDYSGCVAPPAKRARVGGDVAGAGLIADLQQGHRALLAPVPQAFAAAADVQSTRMLCSGAASTSGRAAPASRDLLLYRHGVVEEADALIRVETERLRAGLQEARRRHVGAVVSLAARRVREAEAELARAAARGAELEERLRQAAAEGRAWRDVARGHKAVAAGLRAALDDLLAQRRSPPPRAGGEGEAEDAQSCCFEARQEEEDGEGATASYGGTRAACRSCGGAEACVLVLPCRHLCLCGVCDAAAEACPVCAAAKNASLHVLLP
ncbi:unnamed protein product [Urochloa decumbens]|uniref:RING-type domain-containing protein n=1 Tax=Urochloa decumbens TaxID=240449 RepID=A0ABC8ZWJ2_9POAL